MIILQYSWRNEEIEKDVDFVNKVIKNIRSTRATYNLPNKIKTEAFLVCNSNSLKEKLLEYQLLIETLSYSTLKTTQPPTGCAIITMTDKIQVHLLLKVIIIININQENNFIIFNYKI